MFPPADNNILFTFVGVVERSMYNHCFCVLISLTSVPLFDVVTECKSANDCFISATSSDNLGIADCVLAVFDFADTLQASHTQLVILTIARSFSKVFLLMLVHC